MADEVRNLAMRTAEAAKNTSNSFYVASQATTRIGTIITEMAGALSQQASAIGQVNKAIHEIDTVAQGNAGAAEKSAPASEELNVQAEMMKGWVGQLLAMTGGEGQMRERMYSLPLRRPVLSKLAMTRKPPPARKFLPPVAKKPVEARSNGLLGESVLSGHEEFTDF